MVVYSTHCTYRLPDNGEEEGMIIVICCCAVLEKHLSIRRRCQEFLDSLAEKGWIPLDIAADVGLMGTAVAS